MIADKADRFCLRTLVFIGRRGLKKTAVVRRHVQGLVTLVDDAAQALQPRPVVVRVTAHVIEAHTVQIIEHIALKFAQALAVIAVFVADRQQFARFGVQDEKQAIEEGQTAIEDIGESALVFAGNPSFFTPILQKPLRQTLEDLVKDLVFQLLADVFGVGFATVEVLVQPAPSCLCVLYESVPSEKEEEVFTGVYVAGADDLLQINLVKIP